MPAPDVVHELIARFHEQWEDYRTGRYNETQLRRDFLDPFFKALGWDVDNEHGYAEAYREVIHEDAIKVGGQTKAPDYCFRIGGGVRSFFVEAKKPSVDIRDAPGPAYQLRRYAWSAKLPVSILTDFEEFAVYDCRIRPAKTDKASTARVMYHQYTEYSELWDTLVGLFSPEAIRRGALDRFVASKKVKKGTAEVDTAFLDEIETWRENLARNLALRNEGLSQRDLNFAVQRTIDRLVFLRICEDRGIEPYGTLRAVANGSNIYRRLGELFHRADERYNSGLFYFTAERGRPDPPDELTLRLAIDDKLLRDTIRHLYYPDSPYEFSVLPAEILGQVYEQFLGKVIRLTSGGRAKVEEKPEVRKAGGVYYTPAYIVDYIVRHTVGKLLEGRTPGQAAKLTILDPACGSGSFLIGAYQHLLDWYRDAYEQDGAEKHARGRAPKLYRGRSGGWRLTTAERKRILLANIYGVDIDPQAVEVTKLSLLLKVLEGENQETLETQRRLFHERALPDLANNIKCGNSLIGPDFYEGRQMSLLDEEEVYRINAFDWQAEFQGVFKGENPGFDAVVGNPPYVNAWELFAASPNVRDYLNNSDKYRFAERHWDLYVLFLERALQLARRGSRVSFIIPFSIAIQRYGLACRKTLLSDTRIESIADLRKVRVFHTVPVITVIPVIVNDAPPAEHQVEIWRPGPDATNTYAGTIAPSHSIRQCALLEEKESMFRLDLSNAGHQLCSRIAESSITVGDLCWVNYGAQMSSKKKGAFGKEHVLREQRDSDTCRKTVAGRNLYRYRLTWDGRYVEWALAPEMYGARAEWFFESPKLMIRDITGTHRLELSVDREGYYCDHTILCALRAADIVQHKRLSEESQTLANLYSIELLQGLLASRLVSAYYYLVLTGEGVRTGGGFHTYPKTIRALPVYERRESGKDAQLGQIESNSARMLNLNRRLGDVKTAHDRRLIERQIEATDRQIDRLVYELYELTDDEIRIVEEAAR